MTSAAIGAGQDIATQRIADPHAPIDYPRAGLQAGFGGLYSGENTELGNMLYDTGGRVGQGIGAGAAQAAQRVAHNLREPYVPPAVSVVRPVLTRAQLMAESRKPWRYHLGLDENGDTLPEREGGNGTSAPPNDSYLQGYNEPETKLNPAEKEAIQKQYTAYNLPKEPTTFIPEIARRLGMDWKAMNVEVIPYGAKVDSEGKDVTHLDLQGNEAGAISDRVNKKCYIVCSEHFLDGNKPYHDAVVTAHELRHTQVFNQIVEQMGGDDHFDEAREYNNLCLSNDRFKAYSEIDAQENAIRCIQKRLPDIPKCFIRLNS